MGTLSQVHMCTYRTQLIHSIMVKKKKVTETHICSPSTYLEDRTEVGHLTSQANLGYRMRPSLKKVKTLGQKLNYRLLRWGLAVEHLPLLVKALGSILSTTKKKDFLSISPIIH